MKPMLLLAAGLVGLANPAQATLLECATSSGNAFTVDFDGTTNLTLQFWRETYVGSFSTHLLANTRLAGDKTVDINLVETNGCWPNSVFTASLVLRGPDFNTGFGWFEVKDPSGKALSQGGGVECKDIQP